MFVVSKIIKWLFTHFYQFRIIRAPLARVRFPDFFLADQLNSLSFVLPDLAYFLCFFVNFIDNQMMIKSSLRNSTIPPPGASQLFGKFTISYTAFNFIMLVF